MGQCASLVRQLSPATALDFSAGAGDDILNAQKSRSLYVCCYGLAGFVFGCAGAVAWHELAHTAAAWALALYPEHVSAAAAVAGILDWVTTNAACLPAYLLIGQPTSRVSSTSSASRRTTVPFVALRLPAHLPPKHWRVAAVRHSGWLASALLATLACCLAAAPACPPHNATVTAASAAPVAAALYGAAAASLTVLLGAIASDLLGLQPLLLAEEAMVVAAGGSNGSSGGMYGTSCHTDYRGSGGVGGRVATTVSFFCGNIGLLVAAAAGSAVDMMSVLRSQVAISSQRGAQSGGLVALVESAPGDAPDAADVGGGNGAGGDEAAAAATAAAAASSGGGGRGPRRRRAVIDGVRSRCAPGKRDHLSVELHRRFGLALGRAPRLAGGHGIFVGHTRFATSSQPSEGESHPHQWSTPRATPVWRSHPATGKLQVALERFGVWITHNGDFDFWRLMGQDRTHSEIAAFLTAALGCPSPAKCDSVRVAGMIELLRTQGMWSSSLRLAYYDTAVSCSFADVVASADPSYASTTKHGGGGADAESGHGRRVATRAELAALAAAIEAAFATLTASIEPDDPAVLAMPYMHIDDVTVAGGPSVWAGGAPAAGAGGGTVHGSVHGANGHGPGVVSISVHGGGGGGNRGGAAGLPEVSREGTVHGHSLHLGPSRCTGGIGTGRPSVVAAPMPYDDGPDPAAGVTADDDEGDDDGEGTAAFLRERRPSFDGLLAAGGGGERSLAGAVLAVTMRAAVQRAAAEHHGLSAYGSVHGGVGGSVHAGGGFGLGLGGAASLHGTVHSTMHGGGAYAAYLAHAAGASAGDGSVRGSAPLSSVRRGSLDVRRRSGIIPAAACSTYTVHPLVAHDPTSPSAAATSPPPRLSTSNVPGGGGAAAASSLAAAPAAAAAEGAAARESAFAASAAALAAAVAAAGGVGDGAGATGAAGAASAVARPAPAAAAAAAAAAAGPAPAAAAPPAAGHHGGAQPDIPVSYGQEAVNIACALGWARKQGARSALVAALANAARRHLESTPGWPAWRATVPSLERLIRTALSYFVANDLYTASCRFLKHAKGSFGLAILCSLEPDRLCMGAWGQPMAMSFSQAHHAVLYGSETNCAMIPIATRPGVPPAGSRPDAAAATAAAASDWSLGASAAGASGGGAGAAREPGVAAASPSPPLVPADPSRRGNDSSNHQLIQVRRIEERLTDTIVLNGSTVELIRDGSRHGAGGGGGLYGSSANLAGLLGGVANSAAGVHGVNSVHGSGLYGSYHAALGGGSGFMMSNSLYGTGGSGGGGAAIGAAGGAVSRLGGGGGNSVRVAARIGGAGGSVGLSPLGGQPLGESTEGENGGGGDEDVRRVAQPPSQTRQHCNFSASSDVIVASEMRDVVRGYEHPGGLPRMQQTPEGLEGGADGDGDAAAFTAGAEGAEGADGSEVEVVVDNGWGPDFATHRIDIDEGGGEMMQLVLTDPTDPASALDNADGWCMFRVQPFVRLRVFQLRTGSEVDTREDFEAQERIVQLVNNPYVSFSPSLDLTPGRDYVADDLADVPRVLAAIRDTWTDPNSLNRQTAEDLYDMLDKLVQFAMSGSSSSSDRPGVDVLITGVESSLWIAEQWAGDLKLVFPQLAVMAVSANKIISVLGNARGRVPPTGSTFCRSSASFLAEHHTLCIAVSQSGQTFPTIHAARILNQLLPGRVFALCGSVDTKMALALGQRVAARSPFTRRVLSSCAGGRAAEPPSVVCVALHQSLSELLAFLVVRMRMTSVCASGRPLGMILTKDDMVDLRSVRDRFIDVSAPQLTGRDAGGRPLDSEHHNRLVQQGRRWALHVIETPTAWVLSLIHILATVVSGWPVVYGIVHGICLRAGASGPLDTALSKIALAVDSVIYMFLPIIYAVLLRAVQRRPLWHRMGKRTIVVADVPYVHQIIETFVSKMYALSYGIASVEVHGANPVDHFVHRFTHRVVRGLLIALGRPDGRLYSQTKSESWVLLGLLQAKVITSWGHQPEVVSIGHNPYHPAVVDTHLQLPTNRPRLLVEALEASTATGGAVDPNQLWASRRHMVTSKFPLHQKALELLQEMEGAVGGGLAATSTPPPPYNKTSVGSTAAGARAVVHTATATDIKRTKPLSLPPLPPPAAAGAPAAPPAGNGGGRSLQLRSVQSLGRRTVGGLIGGPCNAYSQLSGEALLNTPAPELRPLLGPDSKHLVGGHLLYGIFRKTELRKMWEKIAVVRQLASVLSTKQISESVAREAVAAVGSTLEDVLHKQTVMEQLLESRYLSLERMLAFMVMFHAMARRTADWWPLTFDIARSQSGLRVATTAAPVTASELEQSLAETLAGDVVEAAARRGEAARRDRVRQILTSYVRRRAPPPAGVEGQR